MKAFAILLMITVKTVLGAPINPDENRDIEDPDLFEGDMYLTPEQRGYAMMGLDVFTSNRQGASIKGPLWPGGVVVYDIAPALAREPKAYTAILAGMDEWVRKTCISFKKRTTETDYAYFTDAGSGCSSRVGKVGSRQDIILSSRCWYKGTVIHEIGHAIGFFHEQSRPDRDTYITILTENIQAGKEHNFRKYDRSLIDSLGTPYDYRSVMHYSAKAFTKNGLPTLMVKQEGFQNVIGQRNGLSAIDADQAKKLYRCGGRLGRCNLPREIGFCRAAFTRYYYNTSSGNCESFIWGGCGGNANNFNTLDECKKACMPSGGAVNTMAPPVTTGHPTTQSNQHGTN